MNSNACCRRRVVVSLCADGLAAIAALAASSSQLTQQRRHALRQRFADNSGKPELQMLADRFCNSGSLFGFTGDRVTPAVARFPCHDASFARRGRKELRHNWIVPKKKRQKIKALAWACSGDRQTRAEVHVMPD